MIKSLEKKKIQVQEIRKYLDGASSVLIVDTCGLNAEQDNRLRKKMRESNIVFRVFKNNMLKLALDNTKLVGLSKYLEGSSAIAVSYQDSLISTKIIRQEIKNIDDDTKLKFKAGMIDHVIYDNNEIIEISDIPSREELLSRLLSSFKSPVASFTRLIKAVAERQEN